MAQPQDARRRPIRARWLLLWLVPLLLAVGVYRAWRARELAYRPPVPAAMPRDEAYAPLLKLADRLVGADEYRTGDDPVRDFRPQTVEVSQPDGTVRTAIVAVRAGSGPTADQRAAAQAQAERRKEQLREPLQDEIHALLAKPMFIARPASSAEQHDLTVPNHLLGLAKLLAKQAERHADDDDWSRAARLWLDGLALVVNMRRTDWPAVALMVDSQIGAATAPLWDRNLPSADVARSACARLQAILEAMPSGRQQLEWLATGMAAEAAEPQRLPKLNVREYARQHAAFRVSNDPLPGELSPLSGIYWRALAQNVGQDWAMLTSPSPAQRYAQSMAWLGDLAKELDKPYTAQQSPAASGRAWAARRWVYSYQCRAQRLDTLVHLRLLLVKLAVGGYAAEHGTPPERLADLVPAYLASVPTDPFDGQPLRYRRDGSGYRCWSVGPDGRDDQGKRIERGKMVSPATGLRLMDADKGDYVSP